MSPYVKKERKEIKWGEILGSHGNLASPLFFKKKKKKTSFFLVELPHFEAVLETVKVILLIKL